MKHGVAIVKDDKALLLEGYCWPIDRKAFHCFMDEILKSHNIQAPFQYGEYSAGGIEIFGGRQ